MSLKLGLTNVQDRKDQPKVHNKGIIRAGYAQSAAMIPAGMLSLGLLKGMQKVSELDKNGNITLRRAVSDSLTNTGLRAKGVKTIYVSQYNTSGGIRSVADNIIDLILSDTSKKDRKAICALMEEVNKTQQNNPIFRLLKGRKKNVDDSFSTQLKGMMNKIKTSQYLLQFKLGLNAAFFPNSNKILIPEKMLNTSAFHEMGHALNANFGKFSKVLQKMRPVSIIAPAIISFMALTTKRKVSDVPTEADSRSQKIKHFVKANAGKLTFLAFTPMLAEEGLASLKGGKIAKKVLDPSLLKKVRATNALGFTSYALCAVASGVGVALGVKIKDNIQAKHEQKIASRYK